MTFQSLSFGVAMGRGGGEEKLDQVSRRLLVVNGDVHLFRSWLFDSRHSQAGRRGEALRGWKAEEKIGRKGG